MGNDCSNCKCTNIDEEKTLVISNSSNAIRVEKRKEKLESSLQMNKVKGSSMKSPKNLTFQVKMFLLKDLQKNPDMLKRLVRIQSLIRKYKNQKIYKIIVKKFRTSTSYFSYIEYKETISQTPFDPEKQLEKKTYTYSTGSVYIGEWLGGFRHGYGRMTWKDGTFYEGNWHLGCAEGSGEMQYTNQDIIKGEFKYNKLNGYGECYQAELGYNYRGNWLNDLQSGMGLEYWVDGSCYMGIYEMGKKEGFGKYQWADNSFFIGEWKDNKIHGLVTIYPKQGCLQLVRRSKICRRMERV